MFRSVLWLVLFAALLHVAFRASAEAQQPDTTDPLTLLLKEGDAAFGQGDYEGGRRSFEKAREITQRLPPDSPLRYDVLKRLTATSAASGQFADAERYLSEATKWRESIIGPKDPKITEDMLLSVALDMRMKEFDRALATAQRVQAIHVAAYTSESLPVADDLLRIGEIYLAEQKPEQALRSLFTAQDTRTKLLGPLDPGLLPILDLINEAFRAIGGHGGNEAAYRQALAIREMLYGRNNPQLINTIDGLADLYYKQSMFVAAEPLYLRLVALWEDMVGKDHPMVAVTLDKLVVLYAKEGELKKAREALGRSVDIRANFLAVGLSHQAADEISENREERAKALYNRALTALGPRGPANEELVVQIRQALEDLQKPTAK